MPKRKKPVRFMLIFSAIVLFIFLLMQPWEVFHFKEYIALLFPKGIIAIEERNLLFILQVIMLLIVIPVFILTFIFSWKYRADNPHGDYDPDLADHKIAEVIWWGVPCLLTLYMGVHTWIQTHKLDPFKPIQSQNKTLNIQVVALQWKWLFIYPEEGIASLNFFQFPEKTPLHFEITADAPMNSFWIPHLGGQIYAMPKMKTELNLIADECGDYRGSSANLSGEYFADMHFMAKASTQEEYEKWIDSAKNSKNLLDLNKYNELATPGTKTPELFSLKEEKLFDHVLMKFMHPEKK